MSWLEKAVLKFILIFLIVFFIGRLIFISYNFDDLYNESFLEILLAFTGGIRMDLSAIAYLSPIILILLFLYNQLQYKYILYFIKLIFGIVFIVYFLIVIGELPIYDEWLTKLNVKAVSYLSNIDEVWRTATWGQFFAIIIIVPFLTFFALFLTNKILKPTTQKRKPLWRNILVLITAFAFMFPAVRGGFGQIPLSTSAVFYSSNRTLNFAAVNSFWNIGYAYYKEYKYDKKNSFKFYNDKQLNEILAKYNNKSDSTTSILKTKNPNIIVVLFESWSGDLVDSLNDMYGITKKWNEIRKESISFSRCYATGRHSEEGMLAVFGGFPSLANSYLMGFTAKNAKIPTMPKKLNERGYQQSFFFGGDLGFANIKSFFYQNPFYKIKDEKEFPSNYIKGKLGFHDDALYHEMFEEIKLSKQPFLIGGFTTSTHTPYDPPLKNKKDYTERENDYMNSVYFADSCLGDFYYKCKKQKWFENTLFIFVSDHSHPTPLRSDYCSAEDHRIVYMLAGGAIKEEYRGVNIRKIVSQIDIPKTILTQLGYSTDEFLYSRNVFGNKYIPFAYFSDKTCQGTVSNDGFVRYSLSENKILINKADNKADSLIKISKALLQKSYTNFQDL